MIDARCGGTARELAVRVRSATIRAMKRRLCAFSLSALLGLLLAGCGSTTSMYNGLNASVIRLEPDTSGQVHATVRFTNPNVYSYIVDRSEHDVSLNGSAIGTVAIKGPFGLPPQSTIEKKAVLKARGDALQRLKTAGTPASAQTDSTIVVNTSGDSTDTLKRSSSGQVEIAP